jgi:hypothetical protein
MSIGVTVVLTVEDIAHIIRKLNKEDKEISKRYREIKTGKVKMLSREKTFRDVL